MKLEKDPARADALIKAGPPFMRLGKGIVRYHRDDLKAWMEVQYGRQFLMCGREKRNGGESESEQLKPKQ